MPRFIEAMEVDGLVWRWEIAYITPEKRGQQLEPRVNTRWKPIAVFRRKDAPPGKSGLGGRPLKGQYRNDVYYAPPDEKDKEAHEWSQSIGGWRAVLEDWTDPGQVVCDPFYGAGSTLIAARQLGRKVIGADIDAGHVETSRKRLAALAAAREAKGWKEWGDRTIDRIRTAPAAERPAIRSAAERLKRAVEDRTGEPR